MTIDRTISLIPVLQAWTERKWIQYKGPQTSGAWADIDPNEPHADPAFHVHGLEWRVKPTPMRIKVVIVKDNPSYPLCLYSTDIKINPETQLVATFEQVLDEKEGA